VINWLSLESLEIVKSLIAIVLAYLVIAGVAGAFQAWMAEKAGDSTAADFGMKTINPFAHIDPTTLWLMPLGYILFHVIVGLSRPVPIIWHNFTAPLRKLKISLVAIAQPLGILLLLIFLLVTQALILVGLGITHHLAALPVEIGVYEYIMDAIVGFSIWFIPYQLLMSAAQIFIYEQELRGRSYNYMFILVVVPLFGAVLLLGVSRWFLAHFIVLINTGIGSVLKLMISNGGIS
jgi:hypothetical protein